MPLTEIEELKDCLVKQLSPAQIYLFGSYADGTFTEESDFDFYIVMEDGCEDPLSLMSRAYKAVRGVKKRPVDILVGTKSRFEERKNLITLEGEVYRKGVLLYGA